MSEWGYQPKNVGMVGNIDPLDDNFKLPSGESAVYIPENKIEVVIKLETKDNE